MYLHLILFIILLNLNIIKLLHILKENLVIWLSNVLYVGTPIFLYWALLRLWMGGRRLCCLCVGCLVLGMRNVISLRGVRKLGSR